MSRGEAWQHIHLLDENRKPITGAFVEIDQELWDPSYRRLTVLFDPGRIKRGLAPNQQMGLPIVEGKHYTLLIDREFHDAHGAPLQEAFRKAFRGGPVDRVPPDPLQWRVAEPKSGTREPLVVDFPKPLDYALLQRLLEVMPATARYCVGGSRRNSMALHAGGTMAGWRVQVSSRYGARRSGG